MKTSQVLQAIISVIALTILNSNLFAQMNEHRAYNLGFATHTPTQDVTWDNGFVTAGWYFPNSIGGVPNTYPRVPLVKLSNGHTVDWAATYLYGSEVNAAQYDVEMRALDVKQASGNNYIVAGRVIETDPQQNRNAFAFLMKTDVNGNVIWFRKYFQNGFLNSVVETANGGFMACGYVNTASGERARLLRVNANGNSLYLRTLQPSAAFPGQSAFREVIKIANQKYAVVGNCNTIYGACGPTSSDILLVYVNEAFGFPIFNPFHFGRTTNQNGEFVNEFGNTITLSQNNSVIIGGHVEYTDNVNCTRHQNSLLTEISTTGAIIFSKEYDADAYEIGRDVIIHSSNNEIAMVGVSGADAYLLTTDLAGNFLNMEKFQPNNPTKATSLVECPVSGNYIFAGNAAIFFGYPDMYHVEVINPKTDICFDWFYTPPVQNISLPLTNRNMFALQIGDVQEDVVKVDIAVNQTILCQPVAGNLIKPENENATTAQPNLETTGNEINNGIAKLSTKNSNIGASVYPTLFTDNISVQLETTESDFINATIKLVDLNGKLQSALTSEDWFAGETVQLDNLGHIPPGMYFIQIQIGDNTSVHKVLKQ